eukprot:TRINITY_DN70595_c0_g1_i1.p1 TRINITY_DN70595_c0_g1~~TRINITY_DN70595_c0_g1_i1.p1  ORF type:complete len:403 (+),score=56.66 TRINITY_DN70595_c0_g1_i1:82-1290(+)
MSRYVWLGRDNRAAAAAEQRTRQTTLPGAAEAARPALPGPLAGAAPGGRDHISVHPAADTLWGPQGGTDHRGKGQRQPRPRRPAESLYSKSRIQDWRERMVRAPPQQTSLDTGIVAEAVLGSEAAKRCNPALFAGVRVCINTGTRCAGISSYYLEHLVRRYGGSAVPYPSASVTHIICSGLSYSKMIIARTKRRASHKIVTAQWLVDCMLRNQRLQERPYAVALDRGTVRNATLTQRQRPAAALKEEPSARRRRVEYVDTPADAERMSESCSGGDEVVALSCPPWAAAAPPPPLSQRRGSTPPRQSGECTPRAAAAAGGDSPGEAALADGGGQTPPGAGARADDARRGSAARTPATSTLLWGSPEQDPAARRPSSGGARRSITPPASDQDLFSDGSSTTVPP